MPRPLFIMHDSLLRVPATFSPSLLTLNSLAPPLLCISILSPSLSRSFLSLLLNIPPPSPLSFLSFCSPFALLFFFFFLSL